MSDKVLYDGKWLKVLERDGWEFMTRPNATGVVFVLPVTSDGKLILIEQYRPPSEAMVVEICAGLIGDHGDELPQEAAQRELAEECGFTAGKMHHICDGPISQGSSDIHSHFFIAEDLVPVKGGGGDETEDIKIYFVDPDDIDEFFLEMKAAGRLIDPKIYIALRHYEKGDYENRWQRENIRDLVGLMRFVAEHVLGYDKVGERDGKVYYTDWDAGSQFEFKLDIDIVKKIIRECELGLDIGRGEMSSHDEGTTWRVISKLLPVNHPSMETALCIAALKVKGWRGTFG